MLALLLAVGLRVGVQEDILNHLANYTPPIEEKIEIVEEDIFTDDELDLVSRVVMAESGYTEPDEGVALVADVIINRVMSDRFPDTVQEVVYQPYQFSTVWNGSIWRYEPTDRVKRIVGEEMYDPGNREVLFFTAGGYNPYCEPLYKVGNHYFGR